MSNDLVIANLQISEITDAELSAAFSRVVDEHKDAVASIHRSMAEADDAYRKYLDPGYEPQEDVAKKDRATLNKAEKNIADKFASLKTAYERPLEKIEANIKAIRSAIKAASGEVDGAVKLYEERQKGAKREEIRAYFETRKFDLLPLEKIFNGKWLNKGCRMKEVREEMDGRIAEVCRNIELLERLGAHGMTAKALYLQTLDIGAAMRQADELKASAERLAREQVEREERKLREQVSRNAAEERREERAAVKEESVLSMVEEALELHVDEMLEDIKQTRPAIMEYTLRFHGTEQQLLQLRGYMSKNGIAYDKCRVFDKHTEALDFQKNSGLTEPVFFAVFTAA